MWLCYNHVMFFLREDFWISCQGEEIGGVEIAHHLS